MAAGRERFSREVIEYVLVESVETEEDEGPGVSLNDILETSISNFTALQRSISNYTDFWEEARELMLNVYHRHEVGVHGMDKSLMSSLEAWPMITSEVLMWLKKIRRQMAANPKASNPWTIEVKRDLPQEIFQVLLRSVQGAFSALGVSVDDSVIQYTPKNHLLPRSEVAGTVKVLKQSCFQAGKNLFSISYNCKRKQVTLVCKYGCWNEFGLFSCIILVSTIIALMTICSQEMPFGVLNNATSHLMDLTKDASLIPGIGFAAINVSPRCHKRIKQDQTKDLSNRFIFLLQSLDLVVDYFLHMT